MAKTVCEPSLLAWSSNATGSPACDSPNWSKRRPRSIPTGRPTISRAEAAEMLFDSSCQSTTTPLSSTVNELSCATLGTSSPQPSGRGTSPLQGDEHLRRRQPRAVTANPRAPERKDCPRHERLPGRAACTRHQRYQGNKGCDHGQCAGGAMASRPRERSFNALKDCPSDRVLCTMCSIRSPSAAQFAVASLRGFRGVAKSGSGAEPIELRSSGTA